MLCTDSTGCSVSVPTTMVLLDCDLKLKIETM